MPLRSQLALIAGEGGAGGAVEGRSSKASRQKSEAEWLLARQLVKAPSVLC